MLSSKPTLSLISNENAQKQALAAAAKLLSEGQFSSTKYYHNPEERAEKKMVAIAVSLEPIECLFYYHRLLVMHMFLCERSLAAVWLLDVLQSRCPVI